MINLDQSTGRDSRQSARGHSDGHASGRIKTTQKRLNGECNGKASPSDSGDGRLSAAAAAAVNSDVFLGEKKCLYTSPSFPDQSARNEVTESGTDGEEGGREEGGRRAQRKSLYGRPATADRKA